MHRLGAVCALVGILVLAPTASSSPSASGLRGKVTLSPARPVCIEGQPCTKPARGVVLEFRRGTRTVARVRTTRQATYRVVLAPGRYRVVAPAIRRGAGVTPSLVRVCGDRIARVDLEIDTGIQ